MESRSHAYLEEEVRVVRYTKGETLRPPPSCRFTRALLAGRGFTVP